MIYNITLENSSIRYDTDKNRFDREFKIDISDISDNFLYSMELNRQLELKITLGYGCNFNCSYCVQGPQSIQKPLDNMPIAEFVSHIKRIIPEGELKVICFWGGEPLVYFEKLKDLHYTLKKEIPSIERWWVPTNGLLLKGEHAKFLLDNNFNIGFSYDGKYQYLRGVDVGDDPEVVKTVQELSIKNKISFMPVFSFADCSVIEYQNFVKKKFSIRKVELSDFNLVYSRAFEPDAHIFSEEDLQKFSKNLYMELLSGRIEWCTKIVKCVGRFLYRLGKEHPCINTCAANDPNQISIDMEGNVTVCHFFSSDRIHPDTKESMCLGNIRNLESIDSVRVPNLSKEKQHIASLQCNDCIVRNVCYGSCPYIMSSREKYCCLSDYYQKLSFFCYIVTILTGERVVSISPGGPPTSSFNKFNM